MRRIAFFLTLLFVSNLFLISAESAIKAGTKCTKPGATSVSGNKKFTCIKSGKILIWDKGVIIVKSNPVPTITTSATKETIAIKPGDQCSSADRGMVRSTSTGKLICKHDEISAYRWTIYNESTPSPSPTFENTTFNYSWKTPCDKDPWVPVQWKEYEEFALKIFGCSRPYRFVEVLLPNEKPKSELVLTSDRNPISTCKLKAPLNTASNLGHPSNRWLWTGDLQIQVIPIEFEDYKGANSPQSEYGKYLDYISEMFYKISDGNTKITFRSPDKYFKIGKRIEEYVLPGTWKHGADSPDWHVFDVEKYKKDVFAVADPQINFTGINMTFVLVPLSVPAKYIAHTPEFRFDRVQTSEGVVSSNYIMPPATAVNKDSWYGVEPFVHLHEVFHASGLLEDHYGDDMGRSGPDAGTGNWGNMSGMLTDFIVWDKWMAGMLLDSQVICANPSLIGNYWITPANYFGKNEKLLVIPISATRAIVVESERQAGQNFKLTRESVGALVFVLDVTISAHGKGINVIRPEYRQVNQNQTSFVLSDAPLKLGESLTTNGYKITVVEAGDFGDVVKVEKI